MNWLKPLDFSPVVEPTPKRSRVDRKRTWKREVVIDGKKYKSMTEAANALKCSHSLIYRLIGEKWRYKT